MGSRIGPEERANCINANIARSRVLTREDLEFGEGMGGEVW